MKFKKQITGIAIFVVLSSLIALVVIALKSSSGDSASSCPEGQTYVEKCKKCFKGDTTCQNGFTWDCKKKMCACADPLTICDKKCCPICHNGECCPENQIITKKSGNFECCGSGSVADDEKKNCVTPCGNLKCSVGEDCVSIENLGRTGFDNLMKNLDEQKVTIGEATAPDSKTNNGVVKYCAKTSDDCNWGKTIFSPAAVENNYLYFNWDKTATGEEINEVCFPKVKGSHQTCFALSEDDCQSNQDCEWRNIFDYFNTNPEEATSQIKDWQTSFNFSDIGWYCELGTQNSQVYTQLEGVYVGNGNCGIHDCITRIASDGTTQINFDENFCSAIRNTNPGGISYPKIQCIDDEIPCYTCKKGKTVDRKDCKFSNKVWRMEKCGKKMTEPFQEDEGNCPFSESNLYKCANDAQVSRVPPGFKCVVKDGDLKCEQVDVGESAPYENQPLCETALQAVKNTCDTKKYVCLEQTADKTGKCTCANSTKKECKSQACTNHPKSQWLDHCNGIEMKTGDICECNFGWPDGTKNCKNDFSEWDGPKSCTTRFDTQGELTKFQCGCNGISCDHQGWVCDCECGAQRGWCSGQNSCPSD